MIYAYPICQLNGLKIFSLYVKLPMILNDKSASGVLKVTNVGMPGILRETLMISMKEERIIVERAKVVISMIQLNIESDLLVVSLKKVRAIQHNL